ncbi:MAG: Beta-ketoadipyl-CoA thiolase [Acidimicrobiales bacterium]|nr:MAG: lipid-transfer protein [Actinomycetota bacterium]MBV6507475.1 Beta-ketoadipyl-CoA thiolase [Acidimicrobiales bacterium]RIK07853.1 MAG: lipid-transfer protein [Acidobacteriota bacterium]
MGEKVFVIGVGMTKFEKPGARDWDYPDMAREAGTRALEDAGIDYTEIEQAAVGYCYGDSTCGQRGIYELGLTGIPVVNVNNNCSTGSTALYLAAQFIRGGLADCTMALGFEKMEKGSLGIKYDDRTTPMDRHFEDMVGRRGFAPAPPAPQMFGNAAREYMERYGVSAESFARIGEKNHRHSVNNPYSQFRDEYSLQDILDAPMVYEPLTKLQCCPTSDGGAAAVLAGERFVREHSLEGRAVEIIGQAMTTDFESTFEGSDMNIAGFDMSRSAARQVYEQTGRGPEDLDVVELHDCFSANEMITYEALGLCQEGGAAELIDSGAVTYGGEVVVNPSGGLISKGHPLGATGLAQCSELTWQLRGAAEERQVDGATTALQHNIGLGGAAVVTMYEMSQLS